MKKILLVDDSEELFALTKIKLGKEYKLISAHNETETYKALYSKNPDIILLDTYVPPTSGLAILKKIREKSTIPIIVISSLSTKRTILEAWRANANCFLEKPFDYEILKKEMKELLEQKEVMNPDNFHSKFFFITLTGKYRPEVVRVIQYIEKSFNEDVSLTKLSEIANITPSYLSKTFKHNTGYAINDFISRYRVSMADELFSVGMSVKEAAFHVGYCDEKYFSKVYKKINGISPKIQKIAIQQNVARQNNQVLNSRDIY